MAIRAEGCKRGAEGVLFAVGIAEHRKGAIGTSQQGIDLLGGVVFVYPLLRWCLVHQVEIAKC